MTSIDGAQIDGDLLRHAGRATERHARPIARKIGGGVGRLVLTGIFLAATAAAVPVIAVYSFIWLAKI